MAAATAIPLKINNNQVGVDLGGRMRQLYAKKLLTRTNPKLSLSQGARMLYFFRLFNIRFGLLASPFLLLVSLFLLAGLAACLPGKSVFKPDAVCAVRAGIDDTSRISVFLNLKNPEGPHLNLSIVAVEILRAGEWLPVALETKVIDTERLAGWQVLLGQSALPPGRYDKIRLRFAPQGKLTAATGSSDLLLTALEVELSFASPLDLQDQASESVFLSWDVEASLSATNLGPFAIDLTTEQPTPITANHIYVTCPDINTVYVVRADKKWVSKTFYVAGRPTYIAIDDVRQKLYVLCEEDGDIKVFDLVTNALFDVVPLPMTFRPRFMAVDDDLAKAFVLDDLGKLSVVDLQTGTIVGRVKIGHRPDYVAYLPATVAVSSSMDSTVYLLDSETLAVKEQIVVNGSPTGILQNGDFIYIAEELTNTITVFDAGLRSKAKSLFVGYGPRRLAVLGNNLYVANSAGGSVSLVRTQNNSVSREIPLGKQVYEMAVSPSEQLLYIGQNATDECGGRVGILDVTSNNLIGAVEIGARPLGIVVGR
jgi:YVTN family beta-propeller protein